MLTPRHNQPWQDAYREDARTNTLFAAQAEGCPPQYFAVVHTRSAAPVFVEFGDDNMTFHLPQESDLDCVETLTGSRVFDLSLTYETMLSTANMACEAAIHRTAFEQTDDHAEIESFRAKGGEIIPSGPFAYTSVVDLTLDNMMPEITAALADAVKSLFQGDDMSEMYPDMFETAFHIMTQIGPDALAELCADPRTRCDVDTLLAGR